MGVTRAKLLASERRLVKSRDTAFIFCDGQIPFRIFMANMTDVRPSFRGICAAAVRHFTPLERQSKPRFRASLVHQNKVMRAVGIDPARASPVRQSLRTVILASYQMMTGLLDTADSLLLSWKRCKQSIIQVSWRHLIRATRMWLRDKFKDTGS